MSGRLIPARACGRARELVSSQLDGLLPAAERHELDRHLAVCEACSRVATEMALVVARVRSQPLVVADLPAARPPVPRRVRGGRRVIRLAAASSALAAATVLGFVVASPRQAPRPHAPRPPVVAQRTFELDTGVRLDQLRALMHTGQGAVPAHPAPDHRHGVLL